MVRSFRSVSGSALSSGCSSWWLRPGRSGGGFRLVARFASFSAASLFAYRLAGSCGFRFVSVRCCQWVRGSWLVSVPVSVPAGSVVRGWGPWDSLQ